jgi:hypothetical protein
VDFDIMEEHNFVMVVDNIIGFEVMIVDNIIDFEVVAIDNIIGFEVLVVDKIIGFGVTNELRIAEFTKTEVIVAFDFNFQLIGCSNFKKPSSDL